MIAKRKEKNVIEERPAKKLKSTALAALADLKDEDEEEIEAQEISSISLLELQELLSRVEKNVKRNVEERVKYPDEPKK